MQSNEIGELVKALLEVQRNLKPVVKNQENPFFKSKYADLGAVWDCCRELLAKNGLVVIQTMEADDTDAPIIVTTLAHTSGQWIKGRLRMSPTKHDPQGAGGAISYGRRYSLSAILGVVSEEDDDANYASGTHSTPTKIAPQRGRPPKAKKYDPEKVCSWGKNEGQAWEKLPTNQLQWYKDYYEKRLLSDPTSHYKKEWESGLKGVMNVLCDREMRQEDKNG